MPSVVGLLEQHELAARRRVDGLREEADRIQAELAVAELEWQEWAIARRRVNTVLAPDGGNTVGTGVTPDPRDTNAPPSTQDHLIGTPVRRASLKIGKTTATQTGPARSSQCQPPVE
ncbi:hypothetical protein RFN57_03375 [Streptomyces violaceochromogenes]|uniref:Transposase n=1 Tax=Streptomyces violaceochromogenes TaxID=67377 RepID=A0ABU6LPM9_9ACTN|nr:hypothetical protein [Streptomyces violaceochromogenes]